MLVFIQSSSQLIIGFAPMFPIKTLKLIKLLAMYPECHHDNNNILISVIPPIMSLMKGILATGLDLLNYLQRFYD